MPLTLFARRFLEKIAQTQETLSKPDIRRGRRFLVVDGVCSMAMGTLQGGPFLSAFAIALGASNYEIARSELPGTVYINAP